MELSLYESVLNRVQYLTGVYESKKVHQQTTEKLVDTLKKDRDILDKTEKVLKHLIDKLVKNDLSKMDNLVTYGLKAVYPERDFTFQSVPQERGNKMWIELQTLDRGNYVSPECKGSVHVIESLLLRLLCLIKMKRARLLILDETFSAIETDRMEKLYSLVSELCKKLKMDVLLVTHYTGCTELVDHCYRLHRKNNTVEMIGVS